MPPALLLTLVMAAGAVLAPAAAAPAESLCRNGFLLVQDRRLLRFDEQAHGYATVADLPMQLNALAYAPAEEVAYGLAGSAVVTVDGGGRITERGPAPAALRDAYAGASDGRRWLVLADGGAQLLVVDLPSLSITASVPLSESVDIGDWAVNPLDGKLYAISDSDPPHLVRIDPASGAVSALGSLPPPPGGAAFGAVSISPFGMLLALHNATGRIYRVPLAHPSSAGFTEAGLMAFHADAAACPIGWDFGDAGSRYAGTLDRDGPRHTVTTLGELSLGQSADAEPDATGDDGDDGLPGGVGIDAEATSLTVTVAVRNTTGGPALLAGWHDLDGDGRFAAADLTTAEVRPGVQTVVLTWPHVRVNPTADRPALRLRLYGGTPDTVKPTGPSSGGEVEDYVIQIRWPRPVPAAPPVPPSPAAPVVSAAPASSAVFHAARTQPQPARRRTPAIPLTWSVFAGLVVPAITLAARVRPRSRR
jgi:hypothetical protein